MLAVVVGIPSAVLAIITLTRSEKVGAVVVERRRDLKALESVEGDGGAWRVSLPQPLALGADGLPAGCAGESSDLCQGAGSISQARAWLLSSAHGVQAGESHYEVFLRNQGADTVQLTEVHAHILSRTTSPTVDVAGWHPEGEEAKLMMGFDLDHATDGRADAASLADESGAFGKPYFNDRFLQIEPGDAIDLKLTIRSTRDLVRYRIEGTIETGDGSKTVSILGPSLIDGGALGVGGRHWYFGEADYGRGGTGPEGDRTFFQLEPSQ